MIRPPSLSKPYDDFFSGDPAFVQAPADLAKDASDEDKATHKAAREDYIAKLKNAKRMGDWSALLLAGQTPTKFVLEQVDRNIWRTIVDRTMLPPDCERWLGPGEMTALLFRLAITDIVGFGFKVERAPDPKWDGWIMAQPGVVTVLDRIDPSIVGEIGGGVRARLINIDPF